MTLKLEGLLYGPNLQHLDHIGPICAILGIPLTVTEKELLEIAKEYYPDLDVHYASYSTIAKELYDHCNAIISCLPTAILNEVFFLPSCLKAKKMTYIWCPHGNSEKGYDSYFTEVLEKERIILCYGPKIVQKLHHHHDLSIHHLIKTGNYRFEYYQKQKTFYDPLFHEKIGQFLKQPLNMLFAPSWKDHDNSNMVLEELKSIISQKPLSYNLLIKLHPNTIVKYGIHIDLLKEDYDDVFFIHDIPSIYPILNITDIYVGTHSSIAYDFLYFKKPIIFIDDKAPFASTISSSELNKLKTLILHLTNNTGSLVAHNIYYEQAFFNDVALDMLKTNLFQVLYEQ
ncbi:MAG: CDP-glycerol glycerophosphotransferase family protein [Chlamydiales bacterium]|nr:CDP-glycerol glycerophosphotransferase family protein [Chlamydiales bacterium]